MKNYYVIILVFMILMLVHIELNLNKNYAPENILLRVVNANNRPDLGASCLADISSNQINVENKELIMLMSLYDFIDPGTFYSNTGDKGYYVLETGFDKYSGDFNINIVCYSQGFSGVSYTIINDSSDNCEVKEGGKLLVC